MACYTVVAGSEASGIPARKIQPAHWRVPDVCCREDPGPSPRRGIRAEQYCLGPLRVQGLRELRGQGVAGGDGAEDRWVSQACANVCRQDYPRPFQGGQGERRKVWEGDGRC